MNKKIVFIALIVLISASLFFGRTQEARGEIQCDINQMIFYSMDGCHPCEMVKPKIAQVEALGVSVTRLKRGRDPIPRSIRGFPSFDINGSIYSGDKTFDWFKSKLGCKEVVAPPVVICGNGVIEAGESCDDGNTISGDSCDSNCQTEGVPPPPPVSSICNPPYTDYSYPGIAGMWCCRTVGIGGCFADETINASGDCCDFVDDIVPAPVSDGYDNPLLAENIVQFAWQAIVFLFTASLYFAVLMILIGSYIMVASGGIPSKIDKGKKIVIWTLIAVAIILISRGIIELVWMLLGKK